MCSPTWEHVSLVICVPPPGKHISLKISLPPPWKHISLVIWVPPPQKHMSLEICVPPPGKHVSLVICVPPSGKHISLKISLSPPGKHVSLVIGTSFSHSWLNHFFGDLHWILLPLAFNPASLHASTKVSLSDSDAVLMLSCLTAATNLDWTVYINSDMSFPTGPAEKHMPAIFSYSPAS